MHLTPRYRYHTVIYLTPWCRYHTVMYLTPRCWYHTVIHTNLHLAPRAIYSVIKTATFIKELSTRYDKIASNIVGLQGARMDLALTWPGTIHVSRSRVYALPSLLLAFCTIPSVSHLSSRLGSHLNISYYLSVLQTVIVLTLFLEAGPVPYSGTVLPVLRAPGQGSRAGLQDRAEAECVNPT